MTDPEIYLFDLRGYSVVPDALSSDQLAALNGLLDRHIEQEWPAEKNTHRFGGLLDWGKPFLDLVDQPTVAPYLEKIIGPRFRLDHVYLDVIRKGLSPIGATLHGGGTPRDPGQYYYFKDGRMYNGLTVVAYNLVDVNPGDGGFACVPGSHKSNYRLPGEWRDLNELAPCVECVPGPAGTAIIFTEALTHGPLPWNANHERRTVFFKYNCHAYSYSSRFFDASRYEGLTERQREILLPPCSRAGRK